MDKAKTIIIWGKGDGEGGVFEETKILERNIKIQLKCRVECSGMSILILSGNQRVTSSGLIAGGVTVLCP